MASVLINCSHCNKQFLKDVKNVNENKKLCHKVFCSHKCLSENRKKKIKIKCENPRCRKEFERVVSAILAHNYCSSSCAASHDLFNALLTQLGGNITGKTEEEIVRECNILLERLTQKEQKVIICFGGFDQLKKYFNQDFFHHLRSLRNVNQQKILFIFGICRRIDSLVTERIMDTDLNMLSSLFYLKPYASEDLIYLLSQYGPKVDTQNKEIKKLLYLSGGNFQFLQLLLRSERLHDPLNDPFLKLAMRNIYQHLTYRQKKIIKKVALEGVYDSPDDYLKKVGLIIHEKKKYKIFSSLFEDYVKSQNSSKLPAKEARLFALLKKNINSVVSKDKIFETVWEGDIDKASDWALDALIYRLRRHQAFIAKGYVIENSKKRGYILSKD